MYIAIRIQSQIKGRNRHIKVKVEVHLWADVIEVFVIFSSINTVYIL